MATMAIDEISEVEFKAFVKVRDGGKTNMFDAGAVGRLSKGVLDRDLVIGIITHFDALGKKFPNVDKRK